MSDKRKVGNYFKARQEVKKIMTEMLNPKCKWTERKKAQFEKTWRAYKKAYNEHSNLCRTKQ